MRLAALRLAWRFTCQTRPALSYPTLNRHASAPFRSQKIPYTMASSLKTPEFTQKVVSAIRSL